MQEKSLYYHDMGSNFNRSHNWSRHFWRYLSHGISEHVSGVVRFATAWERLWINMHHAARCCSDTVCSPTLRTSQQYIWRTINLMKTIYEYDMATLKSILQHVTTYELQHGRKYLKEHGNGLDNVLRIEGLLASPPLFKIKKKSFFKSYIIRLIFLTFDTFNA